MTWFTVACLLATGSAQPAAERDAAPPTVVLATVRGSFSDAAWPLAEAELEDELGALGLLVEHVEVTSAAEGQLLRDLERAAVERQAFAAISVSRFIADGSAELWVVDRVTGKASLRRIDAATASAHDAASTLALRAVELLYASLLEERLQHERRGAVATPTVMARALDRQLPKTPAAGLDLTVGVFVERLASDLDGLTGAQIGAWLPLGASWALGGDVLTSVSQAEVRSGPASADVGMVAARAGARWLPFGHEATFSVALGPYLGVLALVTEGDAPPPLVTRRSTSLAGIAGAHAEARLRVVPSLHLRLGAFAEAVFPRVTVRFGELTVSKLAPLGVGASAGAEVSF